jgi:regulatory protein
VKDIDQLQKAINYAFLLLKYRPRSEKEIRQRLKRKKFDDEIVRQTLLFLKDKDFINDDYFAGAWIESRLKKPFGLKRIRQELELKVISEEIIDRRINEIKQDYPEEEIVTEIAKGKIGKLKGIEPQKAKRRVFSYLLRRGFSPDKIMDVINQL